MTHGSSTSAERRPHARFARDAMAILGTSAVARGVGLLSQAWAARCLGATNLGISGVVQSFAQQTALLCGVGLDNVASRAISRDPSAATAVTATVVRLRLRVAGAVALVWAASAFAFAPPSIRLPWLLGSLIVFGGALSLNFVFQGHERLPLFNIATMCGALATSAVVFVYFRPGIGVGMDLAATVIGTAVTTVMAWFLFKRLTGAWALGPAPRVSARPLLVQSSRYLAQVVLVFFYSQYQVPLIAWRLGAEQAGVFRSAFLMATGLELAFNSATGLLLPRLVRWHAEGPAVFQRRQRGLFWRFVAIGAVAAVMASLVAPILFKRLLGREFVEAIPIFRVLVLSRVVVFVQQVYMFGLAALGRDDAFVAVTLAGCVTSLSFNAMTIDRVGTIGVAWGSVAAEMVIAIGSWIVCERTLAVRPRPTPLQNPSGD